MRPNAGLLAYSRSGAGELRAMELLEKTLGKRGVHLPSEEIQAKLRASAGRDVEELLPQLERRAAEFAATAEERLRQRGESEEKQLREVLEKQRERVTKQLARYEEHSRQLTLDLDDGEKRQLEADVRSWRLRLQQFERDLASEPQRIREFYEVRARRVEPVGLVYLWPESN